MKKKFYAYPSIEQFRIVIKHVERSSKYTFDDDKNDWVYDHTLKSPTLTFTGTVKLHGTNAGVVMDKDHGIYAQKRKGIATIEDDNYGFASWLSSDEINNTFYGIGEELVDYFYDDLADNTFVIYGEWCGGNIQKGVAITGLPKMFVIFGIKVISNNNDDANYWLDISNYNYLHSRSNDIYDVRDFGTYTIDIDFNDAKRSVPLLQKMTESVEEQCPAGEYFKCFGVGEGIVWEHRNEDGTILRFKVKGKKHSSSKVRVLASVDIERMDSIKEFVEYSVTVSRLNQAASEVLNFNEDSVPYFERKKIGEFIKWITSDIIKEELDTLRGSGLTMKDVGSEVSQACKNWFLDQELHYNTI